MQKTKIEWCDYTWNPVKGLCPQACWYCYARAMYKRFKWNPEVRLHEPTLYQQSPLSPQRIFVGSTIDLFHPDIPSEWIWGIVRRITNDYFLQNHTFLFLTKNPARYAEFDFPDNCWLGVTVTKWNEVMRIGELWSPSPKNLIFVSFEPLLSRIHFIPKIPDWIIVGALTGSKAKQNQPEVAWLAEMQDYAFEHKIPLFEKNNLKAVWGADLIQEFPTPDRRKP